MDAKSRILKAGARIVYLKGFYDTGLAEILKAAKVPKGSFYFYFKNKEDFGLQLIDYFADYLRAIAADLFRDERFSHVERIRRFFRFQAESFRKGNFKGGCPIGNLSLEMGDRNAKFRERLDRIFADMKRDLTDVFMQAQQLGEIPESIDVEDVAPFIIGSWEGALMQMKVSQSTVPHEIFDRMVFDRLLMASRPGQRPVNEQPR
ncbi:MAG: TetR family transcriptional regulator C-terminal domain-containing protein [Deltaproteobacteria bacterium]|nr:TetR family transcriptional regulator C-terminal domain-containing protein [Deltaproteobacteria bacterium]